MTLVGRVTYRECDFLLHRIVKNASVNDQNILKVKSGVFPLCHHLCSKFAIAVIRKISNFTRVVPQHGTAWMNPMF